MTGPPMFQEWILSNTVYICWPYFGFGNVVARMLHAHSEFPYIPDWNDWGYQLSPLDIPPQLKSSTCPAWRSGEYYTLAHFGTAFSLQEQWWETQTVEQALVSAVRRVDDRTRRFLGACMKQQQQIVCMVGGHRAARTLDVQQPVIQLVWRSAETIDQRVPHAWSTAESMSDHYYLFNTPRPHILCVAIEDLIYGDYTRFSSTFQNLCAHVNIKQPQIEKAWAFVLYWRDRVDRMHNVDWKTYASNR